MRVNPQTVNQRPEIAKIHLVATGIAWALALLIVLVAAGMASAEMDLRDSHVTLSGTGAFIDGDDDQFRQRHGLPPGFTGGVEDLHMEWGWGDGGTVELDGRGMFDNNDYVAKLRAEKREKGYVSAGYREFRTWYDGTGGFFLQNQLLISYFDEDLALDRGEAWFEAGLRLPNVPSLTARYSHLFRDGRKNSTAWGDTLLTGGFGARNIVPSFWDIDERRDVLDLDAAHEIHGTNVGAGFRYEKSDIDDSRNVRRQPGEAADRFFTDRNKVTSDVYDAHLFSSTAFLDNRIVLSTSYAFGSVDNNLGGSRIYGAQFNSAFDPNFANRQPFDEGFLGLGGSTELREHVGTLTVQGRPNKHFQLTGGLRAERQDLNGDSSFAETTVGFPPARITAQENLAGRSETDNTRIAESAEARYTGVANWVFYVDGEWGQEDGDLLEREVDTDTSTTTLERLTDMYITRQKYGAGATWYPGKRVNLAARYYYKIHDYDFHHELDSTPNTGTDRFPAFITAQDIFTHDGDLRLTWRLSESLRATARYDLALSEFEQKSDGLERVQSARVTTNALGGNLSWNPTTASYVQGDINYVLSETDTLETKLGGAAQNLVVDFDNDYWTASLVTGVALDERTDVRGQYFYFSASNYDNNSAVSQPYGLDSQEHGFSLALTRQLTDAVKGRLAYGYFSNHEELAGGANDYQASAVTGTVEVSF